MRYLVTGAAGLHRLAPRRRAPRRGPRRRRSRLLHGLLRRRAEGGERRAGTRSAAIDLARGRDRPRRASTASSISRGSPACGASATSSRPTSSRNVLASQRLFEAAARDGVRVVFASSSSIYGDAEAVPDRRGRRRRGRSRRTGSRSSPASTSPAPPRAASGSTSSCSATSTPTARGSGRTWRSRGSRRRSPRAAVRPVRRRAPVAQLHVRRRRRRGNDRGDGRVAAAPTTSAAAKRRRCARRSRSSRSSRAGGSTFRDHPAVPGDQRRTKADTSLIASELGWEPTTTLREGLAAQWEWAAARVAAR